MISKRIFCKARNDNYKRLANYIADASHAGEKCLMAWCAGCWAGDDYKLAMQEVKDTQDLSTRTTKEKMYHLVISFRPEDEAKLTPETFKDIEQEFAEILGFHEHQRHCGVHQNTANIHMHIAYNMIHPEKLTRHEPYRDFWKRDKLCRELEIKYGLQLDNGREKERHHNSLALIPAAAMIEAQTGQESFDGFAKRHKPGIMQALEAAQSWQDVHKTLAKYGMSIKPQGNGLTLVNIDGKKGIKASNFDRSFSKSKLEKRFESYEAPCKEVESIKPESIYEKRPLQLESDRGELFKLYRASMDERIRQLDLTKRAEKRDKHAINNKWGLERSRIQKLNLPREEKLKLIRLSRVNQKIDTLTQIAAHNKQRETIKQQYPFNSWNKFLKWQAQELGSETALAILRSKNVLVEPEKQEQTSTKWAEKEKEIILNDKLLKEEKAALLAIVKMCRIAERESAKGNHILDQITHRIDNKGTVIFTLQNGSTIRDNGKDIFWSNDSLAKQAGLLLSWKTEQASKNNVLKFSCPHELFNLK